MDILVLIKSIVSLIIIMALGLISRKTRVLPADAKKILSAFIYYFSLPALFFSEVASTDFYTIELDLFVGSVLPIVIVGIALLALYLVKVISKDQYVIASICIVFGSNAFFGIAFFETLWSEWGFRTAVLSASLLGMLGVVFSLIFFEFATHKGNGLQAIRNIMRSPVVISIMLGLVFSLTGIRSEWFMASFSMLGRTAAGTAMFLLGMFVYDKFSVALIKKSIWYTLVRILALPLAMGVSFLFVGPVSDQLQQFLLIQTGIPAAISISVFAERYDYKTAELSGVVVLSSLVSLVTLSVLYVLASWLY